MDLVYAPAEILKESTPPVNVNDSDLRLTFLQAKMMLRIMEQYNGVGLSASQVSIRKSFFIMGDANKAWVIINPRILEYSDDKVLLTEGCLSYPGLFFRRSVWRLLVFSSTSTRPEPRLSALFTRRSLLEPRRSSCFLVSSGAIGTTKKYPWTNDTS